MRLTAGIEFARADGKELTAVALDRAVDDAVLDLDIFVLLRVEDLRVEDISLEFAVFDELRLEGPRLLVCPSRRPDILQEVVIHILSRDVHLIQA